MALDSWVSGWSLQGPEKPGKLLKGTSSRLGNKKRFGIAKTSSLWLGEASSTSKTKYK